MGSLLVLHAGTRTTSKYIVYEDDAQSKVYLAQPCPPTQPTSQRNERQQAGINLSER